MPRDIFGSTLTYVEYPANCGGLARSVSSRTSFPALYPKVDSMPKTNVYRERTLTWHVLVSLGLLVFGMVLIRVSESMGTLPSWKPVASNVGGLLIASVALSLIWELKGKRMLVDEIFHAAKVSTEVQTAKLVGVTTHFQEGVEWSDLLDGAKELDLLVTAGRTWRSSLDASLRALASTPNARINLILPDPEKECVVKELAKRFSMSEPAVIQMIHESEEYFKSLMNKVSGKKGGLTIWYLSESPTFTFYRVDKTYILATYRHGGKGDVPTFVCYKGGTVANFIDEQRELFFDKRSSLARQVFPPATKLISTEVDTVNSEIQDLEHASKGA